MTRTLITAFAIAGLAGCSTSTPEVPEALPSEVVTEVADTDSPVAPVTEDAPIGDELAVTEVSEAPAEAEPTTEEPSTPLSFYTLRRGETLAHFARWSEVPVEEIAETSDLALDGRYAVGTEIALAIDPERRSLVENRRDAHHRTRAESYLASRGSTGTEFYSVKTGDSAWTIARDRHGMPVWLLESLNPSADLETLRPGDELLVPVFNDIVAEAPNEPEPDASETDLEEPLLSE